MKQITYISIVIILFFVVAAYFTINSESAGNTNDIQVSNVNFGSNFVSAKATVVNNTNTENTYRVTSVPFKQAIINLPYYFYADAKYPILGASTISALGVYDHLQSEFKGKGIRQKVTEIDAQRIRRIMQQGPAVIIMTSGVMPDTVLSQQEDLVSGWLRRGGRIIWAGDAFGYYYGKPGQTLKNITSTALGWPSQEKILGANVLNGSIYQADISDTLGNTPSQVAEALNIRHKYTQTGAVTGLLRNIKGANLGWNLAGGNEVRTSLAWLPVGKGGVVVFGSGVVNREADVAWDISQIIASDIIYADTDSVTTKKVTVPAGQTVSTEIDQQNYKYWKVKMIIFNESVYQHDFFMKSFKNNTASQ